jgi:hypothetical protein
MLGDTVVGFPVVDRSELKWTMDERILMCQVNPFTKWKEFVSNGIILQRIRWLNKVCVRCSGDLSSATGWYCSQKRVLTALYCKSAG